MIFFILCTDVTTGGGGGGGCGDIMHKKIIRLHSEIKRMGILKEIFSPSSRHSGYLKPFLFTNANKINIFSSIFFRSAGVLSTHRTAIEDPISPDHRTMPSRHTGRPGGTCSAGTVPTRGTAATAGRGTKSEHAHVRIVLLNLI